MLRLKRKASAYLVTLSGGPASIVWPGVFAHHLPSALSEEQAGRYKWVRGYRTPRRHWRVDDREAGTSPSGKGAGMG